MFRKNKEKELAAPSAEEQLPQLEAPAPEVVPEEQNPEIGPKAEENVESKTPSKPEKKKLGFWRRSFRLLLLALIFFGLGAIAVIYGLYLPLNQTIDRNASGLQAAEQKISELEKQNQSAQTLEDQNKALTSQLGQVNISNLLLSAKADVASAQFALSEKDTAKTRVLLNKASKTLATLAQQLPEDQRPLVQDMQNRLTLALNELEKQDFAAKSDLGVLMASLLELESILSPQ